jgi:hypothetical protein
MQEYPAPACGFGAASKAPASSMGSQSKMAVLPKHMAQPQKEQHLLR